MTDDERITRHDEGPHHRIAVDGVTVGFVTQHRRKEDWFKDTPDMPLSVGMEPEAWSVGKRMDGSGKRFVGGPTAYAAACRWTAQPALTGDTP